MYYFVNSTGNDKVAGGFDTPFETIQKGLDVAIAGDTVFVRQGFYLEQGIFPRSGQLGAAIKLAGYPGELPIVDAHQINIPGGHGILDVIDKDYIDVENMRLLNSTHAGIAFVDSKHINIRRMKIRNVAAAGIWGKNSKYSIIGENEIELACMGEDDEFITLSNVDRFDVFGNHIHSSGKGDGINILNGSSRGKLYRNHIHNIDRGGIYIDAWDQTNWNIAIYRNKIHDVGLNGITLGSERAGLLSNITLYNNTIYGNGWAGIKIAAHPSKYSHPMNNIEIMSNIIFRNGWQKEGHCGGIYHINPDANNVEVTHNIVSENHTFQIALRDGAEAIIDDNLIDGFRGADGETKGTNPIEGDTQFLVAMMESKCLFTM